MLKNPMKWLLFSILILQVRKLRHSWQLLEQGFDPPLQAICPLQTPLSPSALFYKVIGLPFLYPVEEQSFNEKLVTKTHF